jgi:tRNA U54 and U55 pseudouridine synthase Pus10
MVRTGSGDDEGRINQLSREAPTVNLSYLTAVRAQCAINSARRNFLNDDGQVQHRDAIEVHLLLKERLRVIVRSGFISSLLHIQNTPLRVLHRRSSEIRIRHILTLSACRINDNIGSV